MREPIGFPNKSIKIKLSLIVIAIVAAVAGSIAVILLQQASAITRELSIERISCLNDEQAAYWEGRENRYMEVIRIMAAMMNDYESVLAAERRNRYDDMLLPVVKSQPNFVRVASIWRPDALDGMDSRYIGRPGSTATVQYIMTLSRDTRQIVTTHPTPPPIKIPQMFLPLPPRLPHPDCKRPRESIHKNFE